MKEMNSPIENQGLSRASGAGLLRSALPSRKSLRRKARESFWPAERRKAWKPLPSKSQRLAAERRRLWSTPSMTPP